MAAGVAAGMAAAGMVAAGMVAGQAAAATVEGQVVVQGSLQLLKGRC